MERAPARSPSLLHAACCQALVSGTGISGVVVCLLRLATKATLPDTPEGLRASASAYFTVAGLVSGKITS